MGRTTCTEPHYLYKGAIYLTMKMMPLRCTEDSGSTVPATRRRRRENLKYRNVGVGNFIVTAIRFVSVGQSPVTQGSYSN